MSIPSCALPCFISAISNSSCGLLDTACQCSTPQIAEQAGPCVLQACSVRDALATANFTSSQCGVVPTVDHSLLAPIIAFGTVAGVIVILRPLARLVGRNKYWWDDFFNLIAALICFTVFGLTIHAVNIGLGTEMWAVVPDNIPIILSLAFVFMLLYGFCRFFTRLSIIMFYIRVFGHTHMGPWLWGTFAFSALVLITFVLVMVLQCHPLDHFWLRWDGLHPGTCISANSYTLTLGIVDALQDFFLIALPFPFLRTLKLPWQKWIPVSIMFAIGLLTFIISVIRIPTIQKFSISANVTLDGVPVCLWSNLELQVGLVCACLPTLYPFARQAVSHVSKLASSYGSSASKSKAAAAGAPYAEYQEGLGPNGSYKTEGAHTTTMALPQPPKKKPNPFRAWGLNTTSEITVTRSVTRSVAQHDEENVARPYVPLAGTSETEVNAAPKLRDDVEMGQVQASAEGGRSTY